MTSSSKLYVGNLSWNTTDDSLREAFMEYGCIVDSIVMRDRDTGRSRGFGFITFASSTEAETAISSMNEKELDGHVIKVNLANARGGGGSNNARGGEGSSYYGGGGYGSGYGSGYYAGGGGGGGY